MASGTPLLAPDLLGFWVRTLRRASNLSQDALAEASGLTVRTIQRIEAGERASVTTRRCLARGLGYDNPNVFDDPEFASSITSFGTMISEFQAKAAEDQYPDHFKLDVVPIESGATLAGLISGAHAWCFNCDDATPRDTQSAAASFFDTLQDYADIWKELSHFDRLVAQGQLDELLQALTTLNVMVYGGQRKSQIADDNWPDRAPLTFTIAYVSVVPAGRAISQFLVPRRGQMA